MGIFDDYDVNAVRCGLYARAAGFEGDGLLTAIAVAGAESSWDASKVNDGASETPRGQNGCASWGYWQINACPGRDDTNPNRGAGNPRSLLDPWVNAQAAFAISSGGTNWSPWGAYTSGAHVKYLPKARFAVRFVEHESAAKSIDEIRATGTYTTTNKSGGSFSIGGVSVGIPSPIAAAIGAGAGAVGAATGAAKAVLGVVTDPLDAIADLVRFVINPKNWLRVLGVFVGINLVLLGGALILLDTRPEVKQATTGAAMAAATKNPAAIAAA